MVAQLTESAFKVVGRAAKRRIVINVARANLGRKLGHDHPEAAGGFWIDHAVHLLPGAEHTWSCSPRRSMVRAKGKRHSWPHEVTLCGTAPRRASKDVSEASPLPHNHPAEIHFIKGQGGHHVFWCSTSPSSSAFWQASSLSLHSMIAASAHVFPKSRHARRS